MGRIEILHGFQGQPGRLDLAAESLKFIDGPELVGISGPAPAALCASGLVVARVVGAAFEVIREVSDDVGRSGLAGELEVLAVEQVAVESETEFHRIKISAVKGRRAEGGAAD